MKIWILTLYLISLFSANSFARNHKTLFTCEASTSSGSSQFVSVDRNGLNDFSIQIGAGSGIFAQDQATFYCSGSKCRATGMASGSAVVIQVRNGRGMTAEFTIDSRIVNGQTVGIGGRPVPAALSNVSANVTYNVQDRPDARYSRLAADDCLVESLDGLSDAQSAKEFKSFLGL